MAINQASMFFYPPRCRQRLTPDPEALTDEGKPVQIAHSEPAEGDGDDNPAVSGGEVKEWLKGRGFTIANWGQGGIFERGRVHSMFGVEKEVQINVSEEAGEIVELYCRFTLTHRPPPPLDEWAEFVSSLCARFGLRLAPDGIGPCSAAEFLAAVRANRNYQDFAGG